MEYYEENDDIHSSSWTDIYKPKCIAEIVGNDKAIYVIKQWLERFDNNKKIACKNVNKKVKKRKKTKQITTITEDENDDDIDDMFSGKDMLDDENKDMIEEYNFTQTKKGLSSAIIVTGKNGVGKTCCVHAILNELKYDIYTINFNKIKSCKKNSIDDILTTTSNIMSYVNKKGHNKKVIVIDELESLTSTTEKHFISSLLKNNESTWKYPIILISNNKHNKLLSDIKKTFIEVKFWPPYPNHMIKLLNRIVGLEKIKIKNANVINKILDHAQLDFRRLVFILQDLKYIYKDFVINEIIIDEYCSSSKKKDTELDLFSATEMLLHKYESIESCLRYYETDKVILPVTIHQNYVDSALQFNKQNMKLYEKLSHISDYLSRADVIENHIYGDQNWDMQEVHGFYTCAITSHELTKLNSVYGSSKLVFPMDFNRTTIKNINKKNISKAEKSLSNMNIYDYININQVMKNLLADNKTKECVSLFEGYTDIDIEHIESLLKIDKIQSSKTNLPLKLKKELKIHIEQMKNNDLK